MAVSSPLLGGQGGHCGHGRGIVRSEEPHGVLGNYVGIRRGEMGEERVVGSMCAQQVVLAATWSVDGTGAGPVSQVGGDHSR